MDLSDKRENKTKNQQEPSPLIDEDNSTNIKGNGQISQKELVDDEQKVKKEKTSKPRTRASAKKTIEGLNKDDDKAIETDGTNKDSKMGKKGWWDR